MPKKLTSLADLAKMQFDNLAPDPEPQEPEAPSFEKQQLEAHFSNKGRAGKTVTLIKGFEGEAAGLKSLGQNLEKYCWRWRDGQKWGNHHSGKLP